MCAFALGLGEPESCSGRDHCGHEVLFDNFTPPWVGLKPTRKCDTKPKTDLQGHPAALRRLPFVLRLAHRLRSLSRRHPLHLGPFGDRRGSRRPKEGRGFGDALMFLVG